MKAFFLLALLLTSCATTADVPAILSQPVDTTVQHQLAHQLSTGRVKIKGPVTITLQTGTGNVATTTDNTNAGRKGVAATAPGAVATSTPSAGPPRWVYALLVGLGLAGGFYLRGKRNFPWPF